MEEKAHSLLPLLSLIALGLPGKRHLVEGRRATACTFPQLLPGCPRGAAPQADRVGPVGLGTPGAPPGASSGGAEGGGGGQGKVPPCWGALREHRDGSLGLKLKGVGRNGSRGEVVPGQTAPREGALDGW